MFEENGERRNNRCSFDFSSVFGSVTMQLHLWCDTSPTDEQQLDETEGSSAVHEREREVQSTRVCS